MKRRVVRPLLEDREDKIIIAAGFGGGKVIYKGYDLRFERERVVATNLRTGIRFSTDTIQEAKQEIDDIQEIRTGLKALKSALDPTAKEGTNEESL